MTTSNAPSLILRRMTPDDQAAANALTVAKEQMPFVEPMPLALNTTDLQRDNFVMESNAEIVGFFQIDTQAPAYIAQPMLELCQVVVDHKHQGRGLGRQFIRLLPALLKQQYPNAPGIVLTVNCRNKMAHHVYAASGFHDTGELYNGGPSGPQHIMTMTFDRISSDPVVT
jgi:ribosomal protein S18 acetylase RimI-like enzyme